MTTLHILGAEQDVPRLLSGYVAAKGGLEVAFVLRPGEGSTLVSLHKTGTGKSATTSGHIAAQTKGAAVQKRAAEVADALAALKAAKNEPSGKGPVTVRGKWTGKVTLSPMGLTEWRLEVVLVRLVATYGKIRLVGTANSVSMGLTWGYSLERKAQWFGQAAETSNPSHDTHTDVSRAMLAAYKAMQGLVQEVCGVRDTKRRAALDSTYAAKHPIAPTKPTKDRVEQFIAKKRSPKAPSTAPAQKALTNSIQKDAQETVQALNLPAIGTKHAAGERFNELLSVWDGGSLSLERGGHSIRGLEDLAEKTRYYAHSKLGPGEQTIPLSEFSTQMRQALDAQVHQSRTDRGWSPKVRRDVLAAALEELDELVGLLQSAPALLARTGSLLKFAAAAAASPRCQGREKADAEALLAKAQEQYDRARARLVDGGLDAAGVRELKKAVESLALSAAKAGRSCGAGQTALDLKATASGDTNEAGWTHFLHDDDVPDAEEILKPSRAIHALLKQGGLRIKADDGAFLGRLTRAWEGFPKGSLFFMPAEGQGFSVGPIAPADSEKSQEDPKPPKAAGKGSATPRGNVGATGEAERAAFLATPSASTAKKWVKAALSGVGLEASTLSARSHSGHDGQIYVGVDMTILGAESADAQQRLQQVDKQRPRGLALDWSFSAKAPDASAARTAKAEKPMKADKPTQEEAPRKPRQKKEAASTAEKDALLMSAFQQAIKEAVSSATKGS